MGINDGMHIQYVCSSVSTQGPPGEKGERGEPGDEGYQVDKTINLMFNRSQSLLRVLVHYVILFW